MSPADFVTPLFGPVFRIQWDLRVGGEAPGTSRQLEDGEWPGMKYSAWLLDRRFGIRSRAYLVHQGKMLSTPLLDEVAAIWSEELKGTAQVRFRGTGPDANTIFLSTHYTIEKHREALLWSYFVARMDLGRQGQYSAEDRAALGRELGDAVRDGQMIVSGPRRQSVQPIAVNALLKAAHLIPASRTRYDFSSNDGYPNMPPGVCNISLAVCFGNEDYLKSNYNGDVSSQALFKRMTFGHPECGDCAIVALLSRSPVGLAPFLPASNGEAASSRFDHKHSTTPPPLLGHWAKSWEATDFSIQAVLGDSSWNLRKYAVRVLQRYSYVIGGTNTSFLRLLRPQETLNDLKTLVESLDHPDGPVCGLTAHRVYEARLMHLFSQSLIVMNDDILQSSDVPVIDAHLATWHDQMWPNATAFERVKND